MHAHRIALLGHILHVGDTHRAAVLVVAVLEVPGLVDLVHGRDRVVVVHRRRARDGPLDRAGVPGVRSDIDRVGFVRPVTRVHVPQEQGDTDRHRVGAERGHEVPEVEALVVAVGEDPPAHAFHAEDVHRAERGVESDQHEPERHLAHAFGEHVPKDLGIPVVGGRQEAEHATTEDHVVEVGDDVVRVGLLGVGRSEPVGHA